MCCYDNLADGETLYPPYPYDYLSADEANRVCAQFNARDGRPVEDDGRLDLGRWRVIRASIFHRVIR